MTTESDARQAGTPAELATWGIGPFQRHQEVPILGPTGEFDDGAPWETHAVYNPAAWTDGERVYLLYRAEGPSPRSDRPFVSRIGLAVSSDGIVFVRDPEPVLEPTEPEEKAGCEDPRLVQIDGTFYLTYTAYDGKVARLALARSQDLRRWERLGVLFPDERWEEHYPKEEFRPRAGHSKSGAILTTKVAGNYWMYFGEKHIWVAYSSDLLSWKVIADPVLSPREGRYDARLVEPGPPPLLLPDQGIWLGYNAADLNRRYTFSQVLLDPNDPTRVLRRSEEPLLEPTTSHELEGQVPRVVFGEGLVQFKGRWLLYYGMADSRIGVAIASSAGEVG